VVVAGILLPTTHTITTPAPDAAELHVDERGDGEPLLLLHGLTGTGADWAHVFDLDGLAARHRVVRPDARGHGRSTNPTGTFTFRRCALDVLALMDHLGIARARAVGMSLGAMTLLHVPSSSGPSRSSTGSPLASTCPMWDNASPFHSNP
jgi:pimeloyl-ACP methyl ester carboxylesterase